MMLLDTHALIGYLGGDPRLPKAVQEEITRQPLVYVSAAVIWEIAIKGALGKLELGGKPINSPEAVDRLIAECATQQFEFLDIAPSHAARAPFPKSEHKDPFDRMLAAQAAQLGLALVSADAAFDRLAPGVQRFWPGSPSAPAGLGRPPHKRRPPRAARGARN